MVSSARPCIHALGEKAFGCLLASGRPVALSLKAGLFFFFSSSLTLCSLTTSSRHHSLKCPVISNKRHSCFLLPIHLYLGGSPSMALPLLFQKLFLAHLISRSKNALTGGHGFLHCICYVFLLLFRHVLTKVVWESLRNSCCTRIDSIGNEIRNPSRNWPALKRNNQRESEHCPVFAYLLK